MNFRELLAEELSLRLYHQQHLSLFYKGEYRLSQLFYQFYIEQKARLDLFYRLLSVSPDSIHLIRSRVRITANYLDRHAPMTYLDLSDSFIHSLFDDLDYLF